MTSTRWRFLFCPLVLLLLGAWGAASAQPLPGDTWTLEERPEDFGYSSDKLSEAIAFASSRPTKALMVVANGRLIAQYGSTDAKLPRTSTSLPTDVTTP